MTRSASVPGRGGSFRFPLLLGGWLSLSILGFALLYRHAYTAGDRSPRKTTALPSVESDLRHRLLVFLHPHCPCSRATLGELRTILDRCRDSVSAEIWMIRPDGATADWNGSILMGESASLPNVRVRWDEGGEAARRYDARTSGEVLMFDPAGRLRFRGGITASRGHPGWNRGTESIRGILRGGATPFSQTSVYGCPLERTASLEVPGD
jgi:hypothetical protein